MKYLLGKQKDSNYFKHINLDFNYYLENVLK
jgi:hypothetical protein